MFLIIVLLIVLSGICMSYRLFRSLEIKAQPVLKTGSINDRGARKGQSLMFYIEGSNIESIRFSCEKEYIQFMDWTEQRDGYGNSKNFTVEYGQNADEYYYLVVHWEPQNMIKAIKSSESGISGLSGEEKKDIIVLEITYLDGTNETLAIDIKLDNNGQFNASTRKYKIKETDTFIFQEDAEPNILTN